MPIINCLACLIALPAAGGFQVGGYLENWVWPYSGYSNFNTVYYSFLTLDSAPNANSPRDIGWDGTAIYDTMTLAPVMDVMAEAGGNPHEWLRSSILEVMTECRANGAKFMWAFGGWSDLRRTVSDAQIPALVAQIVSLLQFGGDGIDFDWEHLSDHADAALRKQQRNVLGKVISALRQSLDANGLTDKYISYTSRWNCFWRDVDAPSHGALPLGSDGECLDTFEHASVADVSWVNLMMYDAAPGSAFQGKQYFDVPTYKSVLAAGAAVVGSSKLVMGFEPGHQAGGGIWEGFDIDFEVIDYMRQEGYGGAMFWALNEAATQRNAATPSSSTHSWQGSVGANAQYIAALASAPQPSTTLQTTIASTTSLAIDTSTTTLARPTSTSVAIPTMTTSSTQASTTGTSECVDGPLPIAWSGGGVHTCLTYEQQSSAHCLHVELQAACCFCGGGQSLTTAEPVSSTTTATVGPVPFTTTVTAEPMPSTTMSEPPCADDPLPVAWSGGGVHTCSTYFAHGGSAYCAHAEIKDACCFCDETLTFSALSVPVGSEQTAGHLSGARVSCPRLLTVACLLLGALCTLQF